LLTDYIILLPQSYHIWFHFPGCTCLGMITDTFVYKNICLTQVTPSCEVGITAIHREFPPSLISPPMLGWIWGLLIYGHWFFDKQEPYWCKRLPAKLSEIICRQPPPPHRVMLLTVVMFCQTFKHSLVVCPGPAQVRAFILCYASMQLIVNITCTIYYKPHTVNCLCANPLAQPLNLRSSVWWTKLKQPTYHHHVTAGHLQHLNSHPCIRHHIPPASLSSAELQQPVFCLLLHPQWVCKVLRSVCLYLCPLAYLINHASKYT